ncbi:hypothetical protein TNCV_2186961, partial [Trichonephila clavipes]
SFHNAYLIEVFSVLIGKNSSNRFSQSSDPNFLSFRSFAMREKGGHHFVPELDCMVDALKLPNQTPRASGGHYRRVWAGVVLMEYNTSSVDKFWPFLVTR